MNIEAATGSASAVSTIFGLGSRPPDTVDGPFAAIRETHSGVVFLVGDRAYKCKKPVDLGFLDFRDRQQRRDCCEREVKLNRRFAPDIYLGVAELMDPGSNTGEPLVLMRRMPDRQRLSTLIRSGKCSGDTIVRLGRMMAAFHAGADRSPEISAEGSRDAILRRWMASFEQVAPVARDTIGVERAADIATRVQEFLAGRDSLFAQRVRAGRIIDGHGDLICDDIFCLADGPRILDCLDFDDRLRYLDGLDDIAFLAMDLEKVGAPDLARLLLDQYADFAGDPAPSSLRHHYIAYRAFVRVKVDCVRYAQGDTSAAADAGAYAEIAVRHLQAGTVRMILVGGLPGAGKSTVAGLAADRLGAVLLSADRLRKELNGLTPLARSPQPYGQGLYDAEHTTQTYDELLRRAARLLGHGESVVLDASWVSADCRSAAASIAERVHARLIETECWAPAQVRQTRLDARRGGFSDAHAHIAQKMANDTDPWPSAIRLNNSGTSEQALRQLLERIEDVDRVSFE